MGDVRGLWLALVPAGGVLDRSTWLCHAFGSAALPAGTIAAPDLRVRRPSER
jgi:hypothetical protein